MLFDRFLGWINSPKNSLFPCYDKFNFIIHFFQSNRVTLYIRLFSKINIWSFRGKQIFYFRYIIYFSQYNNGCRCSQNLYRGEVSNLEENRSKICALEGVMLPSLVIRICLRENVTSLRFVCLSVQKERVEVAGYTDTANDRWGPKAWTNEFSNFPADRTDAGVNQVNVSLLFVSTSSPFLFRFVSRILALHMHPVLRPVVPRFAPFLAPLVQSLPLAVHSDLRSDVDPYFRGIEAGWRKMAAGLDRVATKFEGKIPTKWNIPQGRLWVWTFSGWSDAAAWPPTRKPPSCFRQTASQPSLRNLWHLLSSVRVQEPRIDSQILNFADRHDRCLSRPPNFKTPNRGSFHIY